MKKAYTLAEITITLAIIGIVTALTIPVVVVNIQQAEYESDYQKALSALNKVITLNIAESGKSPHDITEANPLNRGSLYNYFKSKMSVAKEERFGSDYIFHTADGMSFSFTYGQPRPNLKLDESDVYTAAQARTAPNGTSFSAPTVMCGSYGLSLNPKNSQTPPCVITIDVNGDRAPNPKITKNGRVNAEIKNNELMDIFYVLITEDSAIPYGNAAQKVFYKQD